MEAAGVACGALSLPSDASSPASASVTLSDGTMFPMVSFGLQVYDDDRAKKYTLEALEAGYRNFFASVLAQNQRGFGRAVRESNVARSDIFVCGSVLSNRARGFDAAFASSKQGCDENLRALDVGPLDMIMLDYPGPDDDSIRGQWAALEQMHKEGKVRSLSVSNFSPQQLDVILKDPTFSLKPTVNQLPIGVGYKTTYNKRQIDENTKRGILVQAWSPLRVVGPNAKSLCAEIGALYNKSPQQIALKYLLQRGIAFTTQSTKKNRIQESIDLFDFDLSPADLAKLDEVQG